MKWEYCSTVFSAATPEDKIMAALTMMGATGWRVIHVHHGQGGAGTLVYFERPVQEEGR